jgi:hypothetical protein
VVFGTAALTSWKSRPAASPLGNYALVGQVRDRGTVTLPVQFQNVTSGGTTLEVAAVWETGDPYAVWTGSQDYGFNVFLVIVGAHSSAPSVTGYSVVATGFSSSCSGEVALSCGAVVVQFGDVVVGEGSNIGSTDLGGFQGYTGVWEFSLEGSSPGEAGPAVVLCALTVSCSVLYGPWYSSLPSMEFSHSFTQNFTD